MAALLVGRDEQLGVLTTALEDPRCAVVVHGEAGVGKTALLLAATAGRAVATGGALASLGWWDHLPLRRALGAVDEQTWAGDPEDVAARVFGLLADRVLVLDDLHWADESTLAVTELLVGRAPVLAAVRRGAPEAARVLGRLDAAGARVLEVEPLDDEAAARLVRGTAAQLSDGRVADVVARAGGNPLLLEELAVAPGRPDTLKLALGMRLEALGEDARDGIVLLALAGRPLPPGIVPGLADLDAAGLVRCSPGAAMIRHSLIGDVVLELVRPGRRTAAHRRLGAALEHPGDRARHLLLAGHADAAYPLALQAVDEALTHGERAAHLRTAAGCVHGPEADGLVLRAARAANDAGDPAGAVELLDRLSAPDGALAVPTVVERGRALFELGDAEGWRQSVVDGLVLATDDVDRCYFRTEEAATAYFLDGDPAKAAELAAGAARTSERVGAPRSAAVRMLGTAQYLLGDARWQHTLEEAMAAAEAEGDLAGAFRAGNNLVSGHESAGSPEVGVRLAEELTARAAEHGMGRWVRHFRTRRLSLALHAGDHVLVRSLAEQLLDQPLLPRSREEVLVAFAGSLVDTGHADEALAICEDLDSARIRPADHHAVRAHALLALGRPGEALREQEAFLAAAPVSSMAALLAPIFSLAAFDAGSPAPAVDPTLPAWGMLAAVRPELDAMAALRAGSPDRAADGFGAAAGTWSAYHRRGELRCRWARGESLRVAGRVDEARATLTELEGVLEAGGWRPLLSRCRRTLRALGERRDAPRTAVHHVLSGREREVLALIGEGLTDAAVAARLGLSPRTVQSHVASARRKLGATNRRHAVELLSLLDE